MGKVKKFVKSLPLFLLIGVFVGVYSFGHAVASPTDIIQPMDVSPAGYGPYTSSAGGADNPSLSQDGRYVAFASNWQNLVIGANTTGQYRQVYIRDRLTNTTKLVSKNTSGMAANQGGVHPRISGDGRYVVYDSSSSDISSLTTGPMNYVHVYRYDTVTDTNLLVDYNGTSLQSGIYGRLPSVSADGKYVAFSSNATNLDPNFSPSYEYAYVRNMVNGTIKLVSTNKNGTTLPNDKVSDVSIDCSGSKVVFASEANSLINAGSYYYNKSNVYYVDRNDNTINNVTSDANDPVVRPSISCSGGYVSFSTRATNLTAPNPVPTSGYAQGYIYDIARKNTNIISTDNTGVIANASTIYSVTSDDGRYVVFSTSATNLGPNANSMGGVYMKNVRTGNVSLLSQKPGDTYGNRGGGSSVSITSDGRYAGFVSMSTGLVSLTPDPAAGANGVNYNKGLIYVTQTDIANEY